MNLTELTPMEQSLVLIYRNMVAGKVKKASKEGPDGIIKSYPVRLQGIPIYRIDIYPSDSEGY